MIVSDSGFSKDSNGPNYAELSLDANDDALSKLLDQSGLVISVSSFADGRAFSLATRLRLLGYEGRIRLKGDLLPDQYGMARRSGIDDIEISDAHAKRCQESEWSFRANWSEFDYQTRLKA